MKTVTTQTKKITEEKEIDIPSGYYKFDFASTTGFSKVSDEGVLIISDKPSAEFYKAKDLRDGVFFNIYDLKDAEYRKPATQAEFENAFTAALNVLAGKAGVDLREIYKP